MCKSLVIIAFILSQVGYAQSFEIYNNDTINFIDASNKKQGHWIFWGRMKKLPEYKDDQKVEEGKFIDNLKDGVWKKYFPNGLVENEMSFLKGIPKGNYTKYFDNGKTQESGVWDKNKQIGTFKRYHPNGKVAQEFNFNEEGRREGVQKYYYDNGNIMIEGVWSAGKKDGIVKEYYENGELKSEKQFNGGKLDVESTKTFTPKKPEPKKPEPKVEKVIVKVEKDEKPLEHNGVFNGTGQAKLFNKNRQISKEGYFENYKLISGKEYIYNEDGILTRIAIYKNSQYMGDGVIEEE